MLEEIKKKIKFLSHGNPVIKKVKFDQAKAG